MKKLSSYQKLKKKKEEAEKQYIDLMDEIEHMIEYPYSSRAQGFRLQVKTKLDLV